MLSISRLKKRKEAWMGEVERGTERNTERKRNLRLIKPWPLSQNDPQHMPRACRHFPPYSRSEVYSEQFECMRLPIFTITWVANLDALGQFLSFCFVQLKSYERQDFKKLRLQLSSCFSWCGCEGPTKGLYHYLISFPSYYDMRHSRFR